MPENDIALFFESLPQRAAVAELAGITVVLGLRCSGEELVSRVIDVSDGVVTVRDGALEGTALVVTGTEDGWRGVINGEMSWPEAVAMGDIRFAGDLTLALLVPSLLAL